MQKNNRDLMILEVFKLVESIVSQTIISMRVKRKESVMAKQFIKEFMIFFVLTFVVAAVVTFVYNIFAHGMSIVDWETSIRFALIFAIVFLTMQILQNKNSK